MKKLGATILKSGGFAAWKESQGVKEKPNANPFAANKPVDVIVDDIDDLEEGAIREIFMDEGIIKKKDKEREKKKLYAGVACKMSLYMLSKKNGLRLLLYKIQKSKLFDNIIMFLIGVSSIKLAADTYLLGLPDDNPFVVFSA
jgi:hypothetical protein